MPSPSTALLDRPKSWDELEDIVADVLSELWKSPHLTRNGRAGQAQDGVDIYGDVSFLDRALGASQVKHRTTDDLKKADVDDPLEEMDAGFKPAPALFVLCTSARRDAEMQKHVRLVSHARKAQGLCPAEIMFWEDICAELTKHTPLMRKHYPQWGRAEGQGVDVEAVRRDHAQTIARFTALQNKRFEVLEHIQALAFDAQTDFMVLVSDMKYVPVKENEDQDEATKRHHRVLKNNAGEAFNKLVSYANHKAMYLPSNVALRVREVIALFKEAYFKYTSYDFAEGRALQPASMERKWANQDEAQNMVYVRLAALLLVLEAEFRAIVEGQA